MPNIKVTLTNGEGEHDITEHLQMLYDTVIHSMDWGSGFLDYEEMLRITQLGLLAGFDTYLSFLHVGSPKRDNTEEIRSYIEHELAKYDEEDPTLKPRQPGLITPEEKAHTEAESQVRVSAVLAKLESKEEVQA